MAAVPAFADVTVTALITKEKDITVIETIDVTKTVDVVATVSLRATKAAEGDTIINQSNIDNQACGNCAEKLDWINNSINGNIGAVAVNQAAGNMNNQANAVTAAVDSSEPVTPPGGTEPPGDPTTPGGYAQAQASVDQRMGVTKTIGTNGDVVIGYEPNIINTVNVVFRDADMDGSVNDNLGIIQANQSAGNINNQSNAVTLALALSGGVALSEADLGQANAHNQVHEQDVTKNAEIVDSVDGNFGIVGVNQTSGNFANQANVVALGAALATQ
jgi:hypothetical protein